MVAYDIFQQCLLYNHLRIYVVAVCDCMPVLACSEPKRHFMSAHTHISSHHPPFYPFTPTPALTPTAAHSHPPTYRCTPTPHPQFHTLTPPPAVLDPPTDTPPKDLLGQGFSMYTPSEITPPPPHTHFNTPAVLDPPTDTPPKGLLGQGFSTYTSSEITPPTHTHFTHLLRQSPQQIPHQRRRAGFQYVHRTRGSSQKDGWLVDDRIRFAWWL